MTQSSSIKINLLSKKKIKFEERSALALQIKVIAGVVLIVYAVILVGAVGLTIVWKNKLETAQAEIDQSKMALVANTSLIQDYVAGVNRLHTIQGILEKRRESIELWRKMQQLLPTGCEMTLFSLEANTLHLGVKAPHVLLANEAVTAFEDQVKTAAIKSLTTRVSRGKDASYQINFDIGLSSPGSAAL